MIGILNSAFMPNLQRVFRIPTFRYAVGVVLLRVRVGRVLLLAAAQMYANFLVFGELWARKIAPNLGKWCRFFLQKRLLSLWFVVWNKSIGVFG